MSNPNRDYDLSFLEPQSPLNELKDIFQELLELDTHSLLERPDLGSINFLSAESKLREIFSLVEVLTTLPLYYLDEPKIHRLISDSKSLLSHLKQIKSFHVEVEKPVEFRDNLIMSTIGAFQEIKNGILPELGYLMLKRADSSEDRANKLIKEFENRNRQLDEQIDIVYGKQDEFKSIVDAARTAVGKVGVDVHSTDFETIAEKHRKLSQKWLIAAIFLLVLVAVLPFLFIWWFPVEGEWKDISNIQRILSKLVFLSTIYFGIAVSIKNYRTHRHLFVVNEHRQTSLKTFRTFVEAAGSDEQTKSAVLLEATRTIFAPTISGYLGNDEDLPNNRVIEILKMVGTQGK